MPGGGWDSPTADDYMSARTVISWEKTFGQYVSLACLSVTCAVFAMFLINSLPLYLVRLNLDDMQQHREVQNTNNMSTDEYYLITPIC